MPREFLRPKRRREPQGKEETRPAAEMRDRMMRPERVTTRKLRACLAFDESHWPQRAD